MSTRLFLGGMNEPEHYRSASGGGAKHTGQRPGPQQMQAWLHFHSNLYKTGTDLEISLNLVRAHPVSTVEVTACSVFFIDAAKKTKKGARAQTSGHTDTMSSVCTTVTLTTQFWMHPLNIFVYLSSSQTLGLALTLVAPTHGCSPWTGY